MSEETTNLPQQTQPNKIIVHDSGEFSALLDTGKFEQLWRIATIFANSQLVPAAFQGKKENCFLGLQMAFRLGVDPMMLLQNTYFVGNKPGMESKFIIALINSSGLFKDPIDWEIEGEDAKNQAYRVRAYAERKETGKVCKGPWIDWAMVKAEGWESKAGSKWKTMPGQMFLYRAAAFFGRLYCPERLLGMQAAEELQDITPTNGSGSATAADIVSRFTEPAQLTVIENETVNTSTGEVVDEFPAETIITPTVETKPKKETKPAKTETKAAEVVTEKGPCKHAFKRWGGPNGLVQTCVDCGAVLEDQNAKGEEPCELCGKVGGHELSCTHPDNVPPSDEGWPDSPNN